MSLEPKTPTSLNWNVISSWVSDRRPQCITTPFTAPNLLVSRIISMQEIDGNRIWCVQIVLSKFATELLVALGEWQQNGCFFATTISGLASQISLSTVSWRVWWIRWFLIIFDEFWVQYIICPCYNTFENIMYWLLTCYNLWALKKS